ncbi:MAG: N-acetyltransferase [Boseongicola sp.]|nr:N-acetyltransferase [Boseongicola sp.]MYH57598.1 N-acetyltransferase [Boseongicola sp. SB0675_bin_26]
MELSAGCKGKEQEVIDLLSAAFAASEGAEEGALIGDLVRNLLATTADADIHVFTVREERSLIGAIIFSRLTYDQDDRTVFLLGPVGVTTDRQGARIGQRLLTHGISALRKNGVDVAMTYGDPNYYSKVGFRPVTEEFARAPFKLKYPKGWLGQFLTDGKMTPLNGPSRCVEAFHRPDYW